MTAKQLDQSWERLRLKMTGVETTIQEIREIVEENKAMVKKRPQTTIDAFGQTALRLSDQIVGLERSVAEYSKHTTRPLFFLATQTDQFRSLGDLHLFVNTLATKADTLLERVREDRSFLRISQLMRRNAVVTKEVLPAVTKQPRRKNSYVVVPDAS